MTQTVPLTITSYVSGLSLGYTVLNLDRTQYAAFTTTGMAEVGSTGVYAVAGGVSVPDAGGYIQVYKAPAGTEFVAEAAVESRLVVLDATQPAVTFGQVKILANAGFEGALHVENSHSDGFGMLNSGGDRGQFNFGQNVGQYNQGQVLYGQSSSGGEVGQYNEGDISAVSGIDAVNIRAAVGLAAADLDDQLATLPTAEEIADAVWNEEMNDHLGPTTTGGHLDAAEMASPVGDLIESVGYGRFKVTALENIGDHVIEGTYTLDEVLRIVAAALAGATSGGGTADVEFLGLDGVTTRIAATVDGSGNRLSVTVDGD